MRALVDRDTYFACDSRDFTFRLLVFRFAVGQENIFLSNELERSSFAIENHRFAPSVRSSSYSTKRICSPRDAYDTKERTSRTIAGGHVLPPASPWRQASRFLGRLGTKSATDIRLYDPNGVSLS